MKKLWAFGPALIVLAAFLWALDGIIRRSLYSLPPLTIVFYEHLLGFLIIAPFLLPYLKREKLTGKEWIALVWVSFFSGLMGTLWFTTALLSTNFIPFSVVFLLQKLQPVFAIAAGAFLLKERLTPRYGLYAILALILAYFVTFPYGRVNLDTGGGTMIAALYAVGAAFAWGSSTAVSRYALLKHSQTLITGLRFFFTSIMAFFALTLFSGVALMIPQGSELLRFLFIALSTGMVALWIYYKGLKTTQTKIATILELVFPVTAVGIDVFLYHSVLAPSQYVSAILLLVVVWKISKTA